MNAEESRCVSARDLPVIHQNVTVVDYLGRPIEVVSVVTWTAPMPRVD